MKTMRFISTCLFVVLMGNAAISQAEDIDIYSGTMVGGIPNLMFVVDNPSSQNNEVGPCTYWDGTAPSQGTKALGNDQCALANIVHGLATRADGSAVMNLGITTMDGVVLRLTPIDDHPYPDAVAAAVTRTWGNCTSRMCYTIPQGSTNRQAFIIVVKAIVDTTGKSGQGSELQETWAYYTGGNDGSGSTGTGILSGTAYSSSSTNATSGCQKNYIIYLSNIKAGASHAQEWDSTELSKLAASINNAVANHTLTAAQGTTLSTIITPSLENGEGREWARFMKTVDINTTPASSDPSDPPAGTGLQSIITYSVATGDTAVPPAPITNTMEQYIKAVSSYGGGKYYPAGNDSSVLTNSILKILNEVQAVNSVFSSSSLPVSVNAQGTYLNQIYMGMFRPDPDGNPRWVGNLKQYHFAATRDATTQLINLSLADSLDVSAINPSTGFITPNAVSFWTCTNTALNPWPAANLTAAQQALLTANNQNCTDPTGGFWVNDSLKADSAGKAYDLPDGEWVDKGGAAQIVRLTNLTDDYTTSAGTATNPRKLYTCTGACASTSPQNLLSSYPFANSNGSLTAASFGIITPKTVDSLTRSGNTVTAHTTTAHGVTTGQVVQISGADQGGYDGSFVMTLVDANTVTYTVTPSPASPATGTITANVPPPGVNITALTRTAGSATVTVTAPGNTLRSGDSANISGVTPPAYNGTWTVNCGAAGTICAAINFTFTGPAEGPVTPSGATSATVGTAAAPSRTTRNIELVTANPTPGLVRAATSIPITGTADAGAVRTATATAANVTLIGVVGATTGVTFANGQYCQVTVATATTFTYPNTNCGAAGAQNVSVQTVTVKTTANHSFSTGDLVTIAGAADSGYNIASRSIIVTGTKTFTYTLPCTTPCPATVLGKVSGTGGTAISIDPLTLTLGAGTAATATATTATDLTTAPFNLIVGNSYSISISGANQSEYNGTFTSNLTGIHTFTYPVTTGPVTPATGTITLGSSLTAPDLINWVRGDDNAGDESGPGGSVTVRPSIHGDVLHSRPVTINYGGSTGVVVYYGSNDGVFRAVNGNQTAAIGTVPAGGELWSFIPIEFFSKLKRLHDNSPILDLPSVIPGISPAPQKKDYFADGSTGSYQLLNADGTTNTAYLYLSMRRGGRFIYALDVTNPANPKYLWKITNTGDFTELGQTWSAPKVASVNGYANPVLIFGAGYDTAEDTEPPTTDTMGRGIFIVDAVTGAMVWSATRQPAGATACSGTVIKATCLVSGMKYSIPADITLLDRDGDGKTDRLYAIDVGGNVWRVDLEPTVAHKTPNYWQVTKLAELGCNTGAAAAGSGVCPDGPPRTTPRKFFYAADVVPTSNFDAVMVGQGDREHPLVTDASVSIRNRFYMLKDPNTGNDGTVSNRLITRDQLFDATTAIYSDSLPSTGDHTTPNWGYYIRLGSGEKVVNAPLTVAGFTYFGTNQPTAANSCSANLGVARGYRVSPLGGTYSSTVFAGGGLPPSPVAGVVSVTVAGEAAPVLVPFMIGGGGNPNCVGADCSSALGGGKPTINVPTSRTRTYWYQEMD